MRHGACPRKSTRVSKRDDAYMWVCVCVCVFVCVCVCVCVCVFVCVCLCVRRLILWPQMCTDQNWTVRASALTTKLWRFSIFNQLDIGKRRGLVVKAEERSFQFRSVYICGERKHNLFIKAAPHGSEGSNTCQLVVLIQCHWINQEVLMAQLNQEVLMAHDHAF